MRVSAFCPSRLSLFLLVVTRITISSASVLLLVSDSSVSALTLDSRVAPGQDAGSIASMFVLREELVEAMLEVLITYSSLLAACPPHDLCSTSKSGVAVPTRGVDAPSIAGSQRGSSDTAIVVIIPGLASRPVSVEA